MSGASFPTSGKRRSRASIWLALAVVILATSSSRAQTTETPSPSSALTDPNIMQAGCSSCGGDSSAIGCGTCVGTGCDGPRCVPGRMECCEPCEACNLFGRIWCGLSSMCCPDPCYQPCYIPAADAAFFVDSAKPVSRTRLRWDAGVNGTSPDRAEYFWSRIGGRGPGTNVASVTWHELMMYTEMASGRFSLFTYMPYRSLDVTPTTPAFAHAAGFGNLVIGTKSMLVDSEILLLTFQFKTYIPTANAGKGIDNGHTSLEPSILATLKVMPNTYFQSQIAEWIPIAGDPDYAGAMLNWRLSLNHVLIKPTENFQVIGTIEGVGYSWQDGLFTPFPAGAPVRASRFTYFSIGPGFRMVYCQKFDIGFGMQFSTTAFNVADNLYRTELRWRF